MAIFVFSTKKPMGIVANMKEKLRVDAEVERGDVIRKRQ